MGYTGLRQKKHKSYTTQSICEGYPADQHKNNSNVVQLLKFENKYMINI